MPLNHINKQFWTTFNPGKWRIHKLSARMAVKLKNLIDKRSWSAFTYTGSQPGEITPNIHLVPGLKYPHSTLTGTCPWMEDGVFWFWQLSSVFWFWQLLSVFIVIFPKKPESTALVSTASSACDLQPMFFARSNALLRPRPKNLHSNLQ